MAHVNSPSTTSYTPESKASLQNTFETVLFGEESPLKLCTKTILGFAISLGLVLIPSQVVSSQSPKELPPRTNGRSGGTRGCEAREAIASTLPALLLLTPNQTPAKITANRPTFAWVVRDAAPHPLTFRLYRYEANGQTPRLVMQNNRLISQPGIMVMALPEPMLMVGQRYLWQVELICDPNRPSGNVFAEADIEVVATEPALAMQLAKASSDRDRAPLYARAGLWHDALKMMLLSQSPTSASKSMLDEQTMTLLQQMVITDSELTNLKSSPIHRLRY